MKDKKREHRKNLTMRLIVDMGINVFETEGLAPAAAFLSKSGVPFSVAARVLGVDRKRSRGNKRRQDCSTS